MMDQKYQELVKWADNNGGFLHSSCFFHTVLSGGGGALSVKSDGQIEPFSIFLRMPYCLTLSYFNAVSAGNEGSHYIPRSKPLPDAFIHKTADHDTVSAVFLMQQYLLGSESFWHPYIQVLPQPDDYSQPAIPLIWNDEDTSWLQGTYLEDSVSNYRKDLELHWSEALEVLKRADWEVSSYTIELFMWAHFVFSSRQFPSVALAGDAGSLKPGYRPLVEEGVYSDDGPRILLPLIDGIDHIQETATDWHFDEEGLAVSKPFEMKPGQVICFPYDKADQRLNNTTLLRDFGFILSNNEACEATLTFPFDPSVALHPCHSIFSVASTVDECYASADYIYLALVSVRSPSRDVRGPVNIVHELSALSHFHPLLVSMVSFRVANLLERMALRKDPFKLPTERLKKTTIGYLVRHMQSMLQSMTEHDKLLKTPQNERQRRAHAYRHEQEEILQEIIEKIQEDS